MNVALSPVTTGYLKIAVLHISSHYIETKIRILYMHGLDRVVEEIAGCEITMKILKTHKVIIKA